MVLCSLPLILSLCPVLCTLCCIHPTVFLSRGSRTRWLRFWFCCIRASLFVSLVVRELGMMVLCNLLCRCSVLFCSVSSSVAVYFPVGSPSRGGHVTVYVWHKPTELAHSLLFCSCVYFCFYGHFNCISFHKFSQQLSVVVLALPYWSFQLYTSLWKSSSALM